MSDVTELSDKHTCSRTRLPGDASLKSEETRVLLVFDLGSGKIEKQEFSGVDNEKTHLYVEELECWLYQAKNERENFTASGVLELEVRATYPDPGLPREDVQPVREWYGIILGLINSGNTSDLPSLDLPNIKIKPSYFENVNIDKHGKHEYDVAGSPAVVARPSLSPFLSPQPGEESAVANQEQPVAHVEQAMLPEEAISGESQATPRPVSVRFKVYLEKLDPYHSAVPWVWGAGVLGALAFKDLTLGPPLVGFLAGYLAMAVLAAWVLSDE